MRIASILLSSLLGAVPVAASTLSFTRLAGPAAGGGYVDGVSARFSRPNDIVLDGAGNAYVADHGNGAIRRIAADRTVTTLAEGLPHVNALAFAPDGTLLVARSGPGAITRVAMDGTSSTVASMEYYPYGLAAGGDGTIYAAAANAIWKIDANGNVSLLAGRPLEAGPNDGQGSEARFDQPLGMAMGWDGAIYVADSFNNRIRRVTPDGEVTTFAGTGQSGGTDGPRLSATLASPLEVAFDAQGALWISGFTVRRVMSGIVSTVPFIPTVPARAAGRGIAIRTDGTALVADPTMHAVWSLTAGGLTGLYAGSPSEAGFNDGFGDAARFYYPFDVAKAPGGTLLVSGSGGIRAISPDGFVSTLAPGNAVGVTADPFGNIYWSTSTAILKRTPNGLITTVAGLEGARGFRDGPGPVARFGYAYGIATDHQGRIYIADHDNHRIRMLDPAGNVTTFLGDGTPASIDGPLATARVNMPRDVVIDRWGNIHVLENGRFRRISPEGFVTTNRCVGCAGNPLQFAVDDDGSYYVGNSGGHAIHRITASGLVLQVSGDEDAAGNVDGTGAEARFDSPAGLVITDDRRLIVADSGSHNIRQARLPPHRRRAAKH